MADKEAIRRMIEELQILLQEIESRMEAIRHKALRWGLVIFTTQSLLLAAVFNTPCKLRHHFFALLFVFPLITHLMLAFRKLGVPYRRRIKYRYIIVALLFLLGHLLLTNNLHPRLLVPPQPLKFSVSKLKVLFLVCVLFLAGVTGLAFWVSCHAVC